MTIQEKKVQESIRDELSKYIDKDKKFNIGNRALAIKT